MIGLLLFPEIIQGRIAVFSLQVDFTNIAQGGTVETIISQLPATGEGFLIVLEGFIIGCRFMLINAADIIQCGSYP